MRDRYNNNLTTRADVYSAIDSERDYQMAMAEKAHGDPSNDGKKHLEEFVLYMDDYMTELKHQLSRTWGPDAYQKPLDTLRKVVTIGVSAMEVWGAPKRVSYTRHADGTDLTDGPAHDAVADAARIRMALDHAYQQSKASGEVLIEAPDVGVSL